MDMKKHRVVLRVTVVCGLVALATVLVATLFLHNHESLTSGGKAHLYYVRGLVTEVEPDANALSVDVTAGNDDGYFPENPVRFVFKKGEADVSEYEIGQVVIVGFFRHRSPEGARNAYLVMLGD